MTKNNQHNLDCLHYEILFEQNCPVASHPHADTDAPIEQLHHHACLEITTCTEGFGMMMLADTLTPYHAGDCFIIPARHPHRSHSAPDTTATWRTLYINLNALEADPLLKKLATRAYPLIRLGSIKAPPILKHLHPLLDDYEQELPFWRARTQGHLALLLSELACLEGESYSPPPAPPSRITPAITFIADHLSEPLNVPELAERCALSEPHFRRLFKAHTGYAPKPYMLHMRIEMAKHRLRKSSDSVLEIAYACGFDSISAFNRAFKQACDTPALQYRNKHRQSSASTPENAAYAPTPPSKKLTSRPEPIMMT